MAYGGPSRQKDNFGRFQKQATINLTKKMQNLTKKTQINVREKIAEELEKKYKENVEASYSPRGDGSYVHTGIFLDSIHVEIEEDRGIGRDRVKIVLDEDKTYPPTLVYDKSSKKWKKRKPQTVKQVYEYLTEGTKGGGLYLYKETVTQYNVAYNHPTPAHLFEQHTQLQMKGFLDDLASDIEKGKYSK